MSTRTRNVWRRIGNTQSHGIHYVHRRACQQKQEEIQPASVYAKIAFEMGYLSTDHSFDVERLLSKAEFNELESQLDNRFFDSEWTNQNVIEKFGPPSLRWGTNDNYPCILLYLEDGSNNRFCYFDCWAEFYQDETGCTVPGKHGPQPILRNVRVPASTFVDQFRFTTFGRKISNNTTD